VALVAHESASQKEIFRHLGLASLAMFAYLVIFSRDLDFNKPTLKNNTQING